jgi:hypothetical protein
MNVVDSFGWLEYFAEEPNAEFFAPAIEATAELVVPVISLFEVFKHVITIAWSMLLPYHRPCHYRIQTMLR